MTSQRNTHNTDDRLTNLEIKVSFTEDLLDKLDHIITHQQDQIDQLMRELVRLRRQSSEADPAASRNLRDDLPPHY